MRLFVTSPTRAGLVMRPVNGPESTRLRVGEPSTAGRYPFRSTKHGSGIEAVVWRTVPGGRCDGPVGLRAGGGLGRDVSQPALQGLAYCESRLRRLMIQPR